MATEKKPTQKVTLSTTKKLTLLGLGLVILGIVATYLPWQQPQVPTSVETRADEGAIPVEALASELTYEELLETRLETILAQLDGAGLAEVMVTVSAGQENVLAEEVVECIQDTDEVTQNENSKNSTNKKTTRQDLEKKIVLQEGDKPFVIKQNRPEIEGVLVLAQGADNSEIKNAIICAVASVLDVPVHKIAVYKMAEN